MVAKRNSETYILKSVYFLEKYCYETYCIK